VADGQAPLLDVLRFVGFLALVVLGPGAALQRLVARKWDPALVIPTGLLFAALAYWASLLVALPWLFPALVVAANLPLVRRGLARERAPGPSLRGAAPPVLLLVALFALTQYRVNRVAGDGTFRLDLGEHVDTAVHVGVTWELVAGYPPQVPGLAGVTMRYHVGSHLVRAAAARWASVHPYDSMSRFDVTLWAIALVLVLRATAGVLGLGSGAVALAGFLPLVADLSWIPGLLSGSGYWAFKLGGNLIEALFFANSVSPALALALGGLVGLARADSGEKGRWLGLAAVLAAGAGFFKVFTGAQLLLALGTAWALRPSRRSVLVLAVPAGLALLLLVAGFRPSPGAEAVRASVSAFAPANPARVAFGWPEVSGLALVVWGTLWIVLSLGVRVLGLAPALRAARGKGNAAAVLGAFALWGWPIATFVSVKADPAYDESFYFVQASGLALLLFASPVLARAFGWRAVGEGRPSPAAAFFAGVLAAACLLPTAEFVARKSVQAPEVVPARAVRAMSALHDASCPGDVVITRPGVARYVPLPVVLAGRRVALANFIPYWRQFTTPAFVARREVEVKRFLRAREPAEARAAAKALGARFVYLPGRERREMEETGVLVPVFDEDGERVYRVEALPPRSGCPPL